MSKVNQIALEDASLALISAFPERHVKSALRYFLKASEKYQGGDWEGASFNAGKFVEAITKCLMLYCGKPLPAKGRKFSPSNELKSLEKVSSSYSDSVRLLIPKPCLFIFDIASNRGARHDAWDIDPNELDAKICVPLMSWVLVEMIRVAKLGTFSPDDISPLVNSLTRKSYPYFEDVDGQPYVNVENLSARETGLLLLYSRYPERMNKGELSSAIAKHGHKKHNSEVAAERLKVFVDETEDGWKLRGLGRQKAEELLESKSVSAEHGV